MLVFAVETSCDETSLCLMKNSSIVEHITFSQEIHKIHGGVVPELASRSHLEKIQIITNDLFNNKKIDPKEIDVFTATCGPGLIGSLLVGSTFTKSLAISFNKPFIPTNHLEGHILSTSFNNDIKFPNLILLLTGGHTQVYLMKSENEIELLGESVDDAIGEAFDKTAKILGLPYPGGPAISALADKGVGGRFRFPRPMTDRPGLDFSFSGLKTSVLNTINSENMDEQTKADIARAFVDAVVDTFVIKCKRAIDETGIRQLVVAGGVSANKQLQHALISMFEEEGGEVFFPRDEYCTDNGAMVAYAGYLRIKKGQHDPLSFIAKPRWSLESI